MTSQTDPLWTDVHWAPYREGLNLETVEGLTALVSRLRDDPAKLIAAKSERDWLAKHEADGQIFQRCYVSRTVHGALCTVLDIVEGE